MKIIDTLKINIIHKLGGYTKQEYEIPSLATFQKGHNKGFKEGYSIGIRTLANILNNIADENYGCSKQEWIDKIYSKIKEYYNYYER